MTVAQTILQQIKAIDPRATWAWGAKDFVNMGSGLKFKTSGLVKWKGYVHVKYDAGNDVYDVDFFRIRGANIIVDKAVEGVYCDMLVDVIDSQVG
jgi:hypothetical protein